MQGGRAGIDIDALQPKDARREIARRQREDCLRRTDPRTGLLREDLAVPASCCVCGSDAAVELFVKEGFRYVQCRQCGLVYVNPRLNDAETRRLYAEGGRGAYQFEHFYLPSAEYRKRRLYPARLDAIERHLGRVGRILDVGSSTGHFLQCARERGWEVHGVELAEYAARYAREALRMESVRCADLAETDFAPGSFDAVTLWDVIEHVTDPRGLLARIHELLCEDGMVFLHTPNAECFEREVLGPDMVSFAGDFHPVCYTKASLRRLVEDAGFHPEAMFTFGLDIAHIVEVYARQGRDAETVFLRAYGDELQRLIDASGEACYLACYARRRGR
ncbi:MAG: class I SAM-dependent methyltransferase [Phycisphaerae bacterium]